MPKKSVLDKLTGPQSAQSEGSEDFDFMGETSKKAGSGELPDELAGEIATSGNPDPEPQDQPEAPKGSLTVEVTLEARKRAGSPSGLDIEAFLAEFKIEGSVDIETLLHGPLPIDE